MKMALQPFFEKKKEWYSDSRVIAPCHTAHSFSTQLKHRLLPKKLPSQRLIIIITVGFISLDMCYKDSFAQFISV